MKRFTALSTLLAAALWAPVALPCGGGFGDGLHVDPSQKIVLVHKAGNETYVFSPHFCGRAAQFGLVLPVPDKLSLSPSLGDSKLIGEIEAVTAPTIQKQTHCRSSASKGGGAAGGVGDAGGVNVVDKGQVGVFDWVLLKADTPQAFTDWLDANTFPYDASSQPLFDHYVQKGWYFIAFKVTADTKAPPPGSELCGDFGPIALSFPSPSLVVPARIAVAGADPSASFRWRIFVIADKQVRTSVGFTQELRFSGTLTAQDIGTRPALGKIAAEGDRLTEIETSFYGSQLSGDIAFETEPNQADFRRTELQVTQVDCNDDTGCQWRTGPVKTSWVALAAVALAALVGAKRRRPR